MTKLDNHRALMNELVKSRGYRSYLEIGCYANRTFNAIQIGHKVGVDPRRGGTVRMTSDEFFEQNRETFDLVYVDGLHLREQVVRDIYNSLRWLNPNGVILAHDCRPRREDYQIRGQFCGDVWKGIVDIRQDPACDTAVWDMGHGFAAVLPRHNTDLLVDVPEELTWDVYCRDRVRLLRCLKSEDYFRFIGLT